MKALFQKTNRGSSYRLLTRRRSMGILTISAFLEVSSLQSQAQPNMALRAFTGNTPVKPVSEGHSDTNLIYAELTWVRPSEAETNPRLKQNFERKDEKSFSFILGKVGTERAKSTLASARVLTTDLMSSMNRNVSGQGNPVELTDHHVAAVFRDTARDSVGTYVKEKYHPGGIIEIVRETLLDNSFDKRIVSPFSPADAGNPGAAYAKKDGIHVGLRNIWSANPRGFVTFSDKAEIDVTRKNPSITLRNPLYLDYSNKRKALITAVAVNYPDWQVDKWSIPSIGATFSYVCDNESVNLTASAGTCHFESSRGCVESRYGEQVMLYAQCTF